MKDFVKQLPSLALFDSPFKPATILKRFEHLQSSGEKQFTGWSSEGTKQRLICDYWFRDVLTHYLLIFGLPALVYSFFIPFHQPAEMASILLVTGIICFIPLYFMVYRRYYLYDLLPGLVAIKEAFDQTESQRTAKCRKDQLSNFALTLIYYSLDKACKLDSVRCNDEFASTLAKLYGVDPGSLKKNLSILVGKTTSFSPRKSTEVQNQFEEAFAFLDSINFVAATAELKALEHKLFKPVESEQRA